MPTKHFGEFSDGEVLHIKAFAARIGKQPRFVRENWIERDHNPLPALTLSPGMTFITAKMFRVWIEEQISENADDPSEV